MINPEHKSNWRPLTDISHPYNLGAFEQPYRPKNQADAVAFVGGLGLTEIIDYSGYPEIQADLVAAIAAVQFPDLFAAVPSLLLVEPRDVA